jgi:protein SCO1
MVGRRLAAACFVALLGAIAVAGCTRRYATRGLVLRVEPPAPGDAAPRLTISHDAIPRYMEAMVMPFEVRGDLVPALLAPGDRIGFRLNVRGDRSWIDRLTLLSAPRTDVGLLTSPARAVLTPMGGRPPDFTLVDHRGRAISPASLEGQTVAMTFIYTRCPLPDYCPRMLANFKAVAAQFRARLGRDLTLAVVTFDPTYDTTAVLSRYARAHDADRPGWLFLTGEPAQVSKACDTFGVERWPDAGLLTHTLQTVVLDRHGRLAGTIEGRDYHRRQLVDLIASVLER